MTKVSKMTKCHYAGTTTVRSVSGNSAWRDETSGACRKQVEKALTWRPVADRSRHKHRWLEKCGR